MTYETFIAARDALRKWLETSPDWPDSRNPAFQEILFTFSVTPQDYEKAIVCWVCWIEKYQEPYRCMIAIGHLLRNRAESGMYLEATKLSCAANPSDMFTPAKSDRDFERLMVNVEALYEGTLYDPTLGAKHYANLSQLQTEEFTKEIIQNPDHPRVSVIGDTTFFQ